MLEVFTKTLYTTTVNLVFLPFIVKFFNGIFGKSNEVLDVQVPAVKFHRKFGGEKVDNNNEELTESVTLIIEHPIRFCWLLLLDPKLGLGEAFMLGDWRAEPGSTEFLKLLIRAKNQARGSQRQKRLTQEVLKGIGNLILNGLSSGHSSTIVNTESARTPFLKVPKTFEYLDHYDLGNEMFELFLDSTMTYSCAVFENPESLEIENIDLLREAQERKLDRLIERLDLSESDHVLEIGCGWGSCAIRAVKRFGCKWTGLTISKEQLILAQEKVKEAGLSHLIDLKYLDYRLEKGFYSKIVSIEMIEAVGEKYLPEYFQVLNDRLIPNGKAVLQAIVCPDVYYDRYCKGSDFIRKHIFPGGHLPSLNHIQWCLPKALAFQGEITQLGPHYAKTLDFWLSAWRSREAEILGLEYSETFHRKWEFYFALCSALFSYDHIDVIQFCLEKSSNC